MYIGYCVYLFIFRVGKLITINGTGKWKDILRDINSNLKYNYRHQNELSHEARLL